MSTMKTLMDGTLITAPSGEVIYTSKNLRELCDHARRVGAPVSVWLVTDHDPKASTSGAYVMRVFYPDGSQGWTRWCDWRVARVWVRARRSWGSPTLKGDAWEVC